MPDRGGVDDAGLAGGGLADREYRVGLEVQHFAWRGAGAAGDPALAVVADDGLDRGGGDGGGLRDGGVAEHGRANT